MAALKPPTRVIPPPLYSVSITVHPTLTEARTRRHTENHCPARVVIVSLPAYLCVCWLTVGRGHLACWMSRSAVPYLSSLSTAEGQRKALLEWPALDKKKCWQGMKWKDTNKLLFSAQVNYYLLWLQKCYSRYFILCMCDLLFVPFWEATVLTIAEILVKLPHGGFFFYPSLG